MTILIFALDGLVVGVAAWWLVRWLIPAASGLLEPALAWLLAGVGVVVATGVALGAGGGLHRSGFLLAHLAVAAALAVVRRPWWESDARSLRALGREAARLLGTPGPEAGLAVLLALALLVPLALSFWTQPVAFDALTYRLARIGHWLQEGRIVAIDTDDARLNYMPVAPDLVMAWLLTSAADGYCPAAVAQAVGGILAALATAGLARLGGLGRRTALGAALLLPAMINVATQFTAAYTDLFTAGVLAAAIYLGLRAWREGRGSWLGGIGAGLAIGSKGTVLYAVPGLLLAGGWLVWRGRALPPHWPRTLLATAAAAGFFFGPTLVRNHQVYGRFLGPEEAVLQHHGPALGFRQSLEKLTLNLESTVAQGFEPNAQPPWWRAGARAAGEALARRLPEHDRYSFDELNRRAGLEKVFQLASPDADVVSTGVLLPLLALAAFGTALWRGSSAATDLVVAGMLGVAGFVGYLCWQVQWHPYLFRFIVLAAPWLAFAAAWWLAQLPGWLRRVGWLIVAASSLHGFSAGLFDTYQSGWPAIARPAQGLGFYTYTRWRAWAAGLDSPDLPWRPALPVNLPLAAFYRQAAGRPVRPQRLAAITAKTAEEVVQREPGWVIVPVDRFTGREGRVLGSTWLMGGDDRSFFSLAAYRALRPGEQPRPLLYRNLVVAAGPLFQRELLVRTWGSAPVRLELANAGGAARALTLRTPLGVQAVALAPGARATCEIPLPADTISRVTIECATSATAGAEAVAIDVRLAP